MPTIKQLLAPDSISYDWNSPQWIVIHYTATDASAYNNALYFSRGGNWNSSAHYFIDGGGIIYQSVPDDRGAWHAGNYECNTHSIGIETVSSGQDFTQSEITELAWLVQSLMGKYGITADRVIRHHDVADYFHGYTVDPHKNCPAPYVNNAKWQTLKGKILNTDEWPLIVWNSNGGKNQLFALEKQSDGYYIIRNKANSKALDVSGAKVGNDVILYKAKSSGNDNQKWKLVKLDDFGTYEIQSKLDSNYVLDVKGASVEPGTGLCCWKRNKQANQQWHIMGDSKNGYAIVSNMPVKLVLDAKDGGK